MAATTPSKWSLDGSIETARRRLDEVNAFRGRLGLGSHEWTWDAVERSVMGCYVVAGDDDTALRWRETSARRWSVGEECRQYLVSVFPGLQHAGPGLIRDEGYGMSPRQIEEHRREQDRVRSAIVEERLPGAVRGLLAAGATPQQVRRACEETVYYVPGYESVMESALAAAV